MQMGLKLHKLKEKATMAGPGKGSFTGKDSLRLKSPFKEVTVFF